MPSWRLLGAATFVLLSFGLAACHSGESKEPPPIDAKPSSVDLAGVDTTQLTQREKSEWSAQVSQLLAPCPSQAVSIAQCVREKRACAPCLPAAKYLVSQIQRGATGPLVEAAYRARFDQERIKSVDIGSSPVKGPESAPITIVEFADFECPACGAAQPVLDELQKGFAGKIRFAFKHFPLAIHPHAEGAARAAVAAQRQNAFWPMHAKIFTNNRALDPASLERMARELGLDMKRFVEDRDSEATADSVGRDRKQGEALQLSGTPSLFINGRPFGASPDFKADLYDWITLELELQRGAPAAKRSASAAPAAARNVQATPAPPSNSAVPAPAASAAGTPSPLKATSGAEKPPVPAGTAAAANTAPPKGSRAQ